MHTSYRGRKLIEEFEGCILKAYPDSGGVWTIGVGHTGPNVKPGLVWTQEQADQQLRKDLEEREKQLDHYLKDKPTTQLQFDALICLGYNIGMGALHSSEALQYHLDGRYKSAGLAFMNWTKVKGKIIGGLVRRRSAEKKLYDEGSPQ